MRHFFKPGGPWKTKDGIEYTIKAVSMEDESRYYGTGWFDSMEAMVASIGDRDEDGDIDKDDAEKAFRDRLLDEIEELSGKRPHHRTSMENLEAQLKELRDGDDN